MQSLRVIFRYTVEKMWFDYWAVYDVHIYKGYFVVCTLEDLRCSWPSDEVMMMASTPCLQNYMCPFIY